MYLSRIAIENFRNFRNLDVALAGNVVIVGENRVGKSNLVHSLRLIFDPSLPDSARNLQLGDFWDGIEEFEQGTRIQISVEIKDFEGDPDVLAVLTDFRIPGDPHTVSLTYEFKAKSGLLRAPASENDFEFVCYGGRDPTRKFGYDVRSRITMDVLPALRDAEGDLAVWRRSPLRPLIESAFATIDRYDLQGVADQIGAATGQLMDFDAVSDLENDIARSFRAMSGDRQDVNPTLGFSATDASKLHRQIKLLIDSGERSVSEASLGSSMFSETLTSDSDRSQFKRALMQFLWARRDSSLPFTMWLRQLDTQLLEAPAISLRAMSDEMTIMRTLASRLEGDAALADVTLGQFFGVGHANDRINLSTLHSAKGREFDVVVMFGMDEGAF